MDEVLGIFNKTECSIFDLYYRENQKTNTMTEIGIRFANTTDITILANIGSKTFYETFADTNTKEDMDKYLLETFTIDKIKGEVENKYTKFLLAVCKNEIVGYAKLREDRNGAHFKETDAIEIERIYVLKSHLNKQVGAALMSFSIDFAEKNNFKIIWLGVWERNSKAINFYERWGFEKFGSHIFVLGDDEQTDWLMKKEIEDQNTILLKRPF
jgi:GNAT superfamily N-acetyltransferase